MAIGDGIAAYEKSSKVYSKLLNTHIGVLKCWVLVVDSKAE